MCRIREKETNSGRKYKNTSKVLTKFYWIQMGKHTNCSFVKIDEKDNNWEKKPKLRNKHKINFKDEFRIKDHGSHLIIIDYNNKDNK